MEIKSFSSFEESAKHELLVYGRWDEGKTDRAKARLEFYRRSLDELLHNASRRSTLEGEIASLEARIRILAFDAE
jgi:hypothetical protein